ncbi:GHKL domain-containing protein [Roseateles sp. DAIF2]|uniref:sensor histidine kinase n=1 Tax=Roseateles sp. DAIF2 TaxID=2714952 RepID=UPI0018A2CA2D|nr:ATP-binding protein [Roseateles sp. DAIF2]QPF73141.1 GHKL domain-containing protein [Roseateles sp. DAIF2]
MNSLSEARLASRRWPWMGAALLVLLLLAAWLLWPAGGAYAAPLLAGLCLGLLMLAVAGIGWHVGVRLTRQRLGESLREVRGQLQLMSQLQSDWQWQTDAQHHLVRWQAPQAAPASSWVGVAATQSLWERFALVEGQEASLLQRLQERAPFADVLVEARLEGGAAAQFSGRWLLRGQVCLDGFGRFQGYLGTARPVPRPAPEGQQAAGLAPPVPVASDERDHGWIQSLPGPAWLVAEASGAHPRLLELNASAAQLMGRPPEQLRGEPWRACLDCLPAEVREAAAAPTAASGLPCGPWWLCLTAVAGRPGLALLSLWPQGAPDTVPATLAVEAAEVARAEHESFSYTVSHDLRAPLRVVEGFARILKEDYGRLLDRIGNDHLDRVMGAAARMNSMIDALLSLTQLSSQPLQRQTVNLSQLATLVIEELRRNAPERRALVQIEPELQVQGDPTLLRMVLENLLGNAWKYSSKTAHTEIRFERQQLGGELVFVVSDNGAGFDMRFAERLFGVFQRLHSASDFQGTGVGLASVRRIVHRHGGEIWAESEVGQGARFFFTLG